MTGRIKHMERSHRSVASKRNAGVFNHFNRRAYTIQAYKKQTEAAFGSGLAGLLRRAAGVVKKGDK